MLALVPLREQYMGKLLYFALFIQGWSSATLEHGLVRTLLHSCDTFDLDISSQWQLLHADTGAGLDKEKD